MIPPLPAGFDASQVIAIAFAILYCRMLHVTRAERKARKELKSSGWSPMLNEAGK